jgi:hypothetical protein
LKSSDLIGFVSSELATFLEEEHPTNKKSAKKIPKILILK